MKILEIYGEDYPWDVRVDKLLTGICRAGHETHLLCRNLKRQPLREKSGSINCHRVLSPETNSFFHQFLSIPSPYNPLWYRALQKVKVEIEPDLLIVRDLPLAPLGIFLGHKYGLPVVVDFAENHPAMWNNVIASDKYPIRSWLLKNPILARHLEKKVAHQADMMFVVVEEMRDHLISIGARADRIQIVSNTPPRKILKEPFSDSKSGGKDLNLVFVGNLTRNRGLQQILKAIAGIPENGSITRFDIVGSGDHLGPLKSLADDLGLADKVVFHGWVENSQIPELISHCNVGVIPHLKTEHTDTTIPNKLFDFMALALPVVVSNCTPLKRLVEEEDCGVSFECGNIPSLIDSIQALRSEEVRFNFGSNGRKAVKRRYHWEYDLSIALDVVDKLTSSSRHKSRSANNSLGT